MNERLVGTGWPGEDPLGQRLRLFDGNTPDAWLTVVGVVSNIVENDVTGQRFEPVVYVPSRQRSAGLGDDVVIARTSVPPGSLGSAFRAEIQAIDGLPPNSVLPANLRVPEKFTKCSG